MSPINNSEEPDTFFIVETDLIGLKSRVPSSDSYLNLSGTSSVVNLAGARPLAISMNTLYCRIDIAEPRPPATHGLKAALSLTAVGAWLSSVRGNCNTVAR